MGLNFANLTQGLFPGGRCIGKRHYFGTTDYDGTIKKPPFPTVLFVELQPVGDDAEAFTEIFSMGKGLVPTKDGKGFDSAPGAKAKDGIGKGTKAGMYIGSILKPHDEPEKGLDPRQMGDDIGVLDGIEYNLKRVDMPKWTGKATEVFAGQGGNNDEPKTVLIVTEIFVPPPAFGGKASKGKATAPAKAKAAPEPEPAEEAAGGDDDLKAEVVEKISEFLREQPQRTATVNKVSRAVFNAFKKSDNQDAAVKLANDDDFLGDDDAPWNYDDSDSTLQLIK